MAVRLLHFADLHLGVENYGRLNPSTGLNSRFEDFTRTLDSVVDYALTHDVDMVIFAGDAYKNRDPSPTHQRVFARAMRRLSEAAIPTVILVGNHDVPNTRGRAHSVEVFHVLDVPHIHVADRPDLLRLETRSGPVQVIALPYRRPSILMENAEHRARPRQEAHQAIASEYRQLAQELGRDLDPNVPAVLAGHIHEAGAEVGSEKGMLLSDEPIVGLSDLLWPGNTLDYVALGHMHRHQNRNPGGYPPVVYSGSLERIDFGEENDDKGFVIVSLLRAGATYEFVPVAARRFVTVDCHLQSETPAAELEEAISKANIRDSVVRLRYTIPEGLRMLLAGAELHRLLADAFCIGQIERQVTRPELHTRDPLLTNELDALQALERFVHARQPRVQPEEMLAYGKALIAELSQRESNL
jgi:exonuclease SbcD